MQILRIFLFQNKSEKPPKPCHDVSHFDLLVGNTSLDQILKIEVESIWTAAKEGESQRQIFVDKSIKPLKTNMQLPQDVVESANMKFADMMLRNMMGLLQYSGDFRRWIEYKGETGE